MSLYNLARVFWGEWLDKEIMRYSAAHIKWWASDNVQNITCHDVQSGSYFGDSPRLHPGK